MTNIDYSDPAWYSKLLEARLALVKIGAWVGYCDCIDSLYQIKSEDEAEGIREEFRMEMEEDEPGRAPMVWATRQEAVEDLKEDDADRHPNP